MNNQKFTQKTIEVINNAQNLATQNGNSQIEQEHLLYSLLTYENSLIKQLLKKMNVSDNFEKEVFEIIPDVPITNIRISINALNLLNFITSSFRFLLRLLIYFYVC